MEHENASPTTCNPAPLSLLEKFALGQIQKRILYIDVDIDWNNPLNTIKNAIDAGFNVLLFAFYLNSGESDMLLAWKSMSANEKSQAFQYATAHHSLLGFSAGGSSEIPYILDPTTYANTLGKYALQEHFQIVDCDFENIAPGFTYPGVDLYHWFKNLNATLLSLLGSKALLSHCPQLPYISQMNFPGSWTGNKGGFAQVYVDNPKIAWFTFQVYNQNSYLTYETAFVTSDAKMFPGSALKQISTTDNTNGIPWHKICFGTYLQANDANNGVHDPSVLKNWFAQAAKQFGYDRSVMCWQYHTVGMPLPNQFIKTLYG